MKSTILNAKLNRLNSRITAKQNNLLDHITVEADLIVSNILAEVIVRFVDSAWNRLISGGYFITSGITQTKKQLVKDRIEQQGFNIIQVNEMEDWISIVAQKI